MHPNGTRTLVTGLALIGVAAAAGTALAASNTVTPSNAGQGSGTVAGFTVTNIQYDGAPAADEPEPTVNVVRFDIARTGANSAVPVSSANAAVYVQLLSGTADNGDADWAGCTVVAGVAECTLTGGESMPVVDVEDVSVVAYDTLPA
jgi:hypothetical protein